MRLLKIIWWIPLKMTSFGRSPNIFLKLLSKDNWKAMSSYIVGWILKATNSSIQNEKFHVPNRILFTFYTAFSLSVKNHWKRKKKYMASNVCWVNI